MAGVRGPLFGLDASGSIGNAITFSKWKGRAYVRIKATPSNPKSAGQIATRSMMKFLSQAWGVLSDANKATWEPLAASGNYSPFNAYVKYNMDLWTQFANPIDAIGEVAGVAPVLGVMTLTAGVRQAGVSIVVTTANDLWGVIMFAKLGSAPGDSKTAVQLIPAAPGDPVACVLTGLVPGTWHVQARGFNIGGTSSNLIADANVVVTG